MPQYIPRAILPERLDEFTRGYLECAEWCGIEHEAFELSVSPSWDQASLDSAMEDCASFRAECEEDLEAIDDYQAGVDFFLTRNGHGAGFWDRGHGPAGDRLTEACKPYGEANVFFDAETETLSHE